MSGAIQFDDIRFAFRSRSFCLSSVGFIGLLSYVK